MSGWLRNQARKIGPLRTVYLWLKKPLAPQTASALRERSLVFLLQAVYYLLVSPYAIIRRLLFRRSLYRARSGWTPNRQTTADPDIYDKLV